MALAAGSLSSHFTTLDWVIVGAYLALTTVIGATLAGKQATIRDFFLGGRKLPWFAVSGSIIATEISALTFISVPSVVFRPGGNFTYLQLGVFGSFFARLIVGYVLVPQYYKREIYSPYDYMGHRLGAGVRPMTTVLFALSSLLAQSARVYLTAEVLLVVMHDQLTGLSSQFGLNPLAWAIVLIGLVSVTWTLIGGISTVIWTDLMLFIVFLLGAGIALVTVILSLDQGVADFVRMGWQAKDSGPWGKFTFFDFDADPRRAYTIWTAVIASTWGGLGAYGTDQLLAQRIFCCRGERQARWAIISSAVGQVVTATVMLVGVGLYAYYRQRPLTGEAAEVVAANTDRVFPVFIVQEIKPGWTGLIIAGVFAAAISSMTSILAALSQTVMSAFYAPVARLLGRSGDPSDDGSGGQSVLLGRVLVVFWGVVMCFMAYVASEIKEQYKSILDLGLAMAGIAGGALLAGFALSFLPLRIDGRGFLYSGPLSVLCVFALIWHEQWAFQTCTILAIVLILCWVGHLLLGGGAAPAVDDGSRNGIRSGIQTLLLLVGIGLMFAIQKYGYWDGAPGGDGEPAKETIAWPWYIPIGSTIAFLWGYWLARPARRPV